MTSQRFVLSSLGACVLALSLTACGERETGPDLSPYAGGEVAESQSPAQTPATIPSTIPSTDEAGSTNSAQTFSDEGDGLTALEIAAQEVCAAGDEGFAAVLPEGTAFTARGGDGRVHAAWNVDGSQEEAIINILDLETEERLAFEGGVADFMRHNMVAGFDRSELTGAFRYRDGRFCVVQTEAEVINAFQGVVRTALSQIAAQ